MKKDLGVNPYLFPMPVLMIATYGEDGVVDVMNMAWGGICAENMVSLNISEGHKTSENIKKRGAFTLSIADIPHIKEADFLGTASGNTMPDKFARSGLTAVKIFVKHCNLHTGPAGVHSSGKSGRAGSYYQYISHNNLHSAVTASRQAKQ